MKTTDLKERTAYATAIIAFVIGWGITIWGFCIPPKGEISASVLTVLGEAMVYTASVFGVTLYFSSQMVRLRHETREYIRKLERNEDDNVQEEESE